MSRRYIVSIFFLLFFSLSAFSQNEGQLKYILSKKRTTREGINRENKSYRTFSEYFKVDLNGDGYLEGLVVENSDTGSSIHFFENHYEHFQELTISSGGNFSKVDKLEIKHISRTENILIIYFNEGLTKYLSSRSRQRVYLVYIPEQLFKKPFKAFRGPVVYEEYESKGHYHVRKYDLKLEDLNQDGVEEVLITNRNVEKVIYLNAKKELISL